MCENKAKVVLKVRIMDGVNILNGGFYRIKLVA